MEKENMLCWIFCWLAVFVSMNATASDASSSFKDEIFKKAREEAMAIEGDVRNLKNNAKQYGTLEMMEEIITKAKTDSKQYEDVTNEAKRHAAHEVKDLQITVAKAKNSAKEFAKNWAINKDDNMRETFTGYADLNTVKGTVKNDTVFYIFVSFSMPMKLLKTLDEGARKIGGRLVIRGLKDDSFKETVSYIQELNKEGIKMDINPKLFENFKIKHVPSFVMWDKKKNLYDKVAGNVTIGYVLEEFVTQGDTRQVSLKYQQKQRGNL